MKENVTDLKTLAKKTKEQLMTDLWVCIHHEYDKQNDLLCMTERYYLYPEQRAELQTEMLELLLDKPYKNPFEFYFRYSQYHMVELDDILTGFAEEMTHTTNPKLALENVIVQIGEVHDKCFRELIDDWRGEKLETYLLAVADFAEARLILESNKRW
ncbi:MAG: hypothetical protein R3Y63_13155 [Eubacteriales bacterium]